MIEVFQRSGAAAVIDRTIKFKTRKRGLTASQMVASHLALWSAGGERCEDFDHLRQDRNRQPSPAMDARSCAGGQ